jgi:uncharacterized protein
VSARRRILSAVLLAAWWVAAAPLMSAAASPGPTFPPPTGYVNDVADLLDPAERAQLEQELAQYDQRTGNQISMAIFPDLQGVPINEFAVRLEEAWKVGRKGKDNGVLVLVAVKERQVRIEVGYGLESAITDTDAGEIIRDAIVPAFRTGDYGQGLLAAADRLMGLIDIGPSGAPPAGGAPGPSSGPAPLAGAWRAMPGGVGLLPVVLFLLFVVFSLGVSRARVLRCPRCGSALRPSDQGTRAFGAHALQAWVCPQCGYREKRILPPGASSAGPVWFGGGGFAWGTGDFGGGRGFGGFGGGSSGGGGATGGW